VSWLWSKLEADFARVMDEDGYCAIRWQYICVHETIRDMWTFCIAKEVPGAWVDQYVYHTWGDRQRRAVYKVQIINSGQDEEFIVKELSSFFTCSIPYEHCSFTPSFRLQFDAPCYGRPAFMNASSWSSTSYANPLCHYSASCTSVTGNLRPVHVLHSRP